MKKLLVLALACMLCLTVLAGCSTKTAELALITDTGTIDDKSFNQGSWEGLVKYAEENKVSHQFYKPTEKSNDAYLATIDLAVKNGAKLIVTPGFLFEEAVFIAQDTYPDVKFVLIDGSPHDADYVYKTADNTVGITYAEEQAGFLAGYAAVKDGYTKLGFIGGMVAPAVVRYGYGFVQGADYAAKELELSAEAIEMKYTYTNNFDATFEAKAMAGSWYTDGTEIVFACGGAVGDAVMAAADEAGAKVIGVDVDQSGESTTVVTSAMKGIGASVYTIIKDFYANSFPGGQNLIFDAKNQGVQIAIETARFNKFTSADYEDIFGELMNDTNKVASNILNTPSKDGMISSSDIKPEIVKMDEVK